MTVSCLASGDLAKVKLPAPARYDVFCMLVVKSSQLDHPFGVRKNLFWEDGGVLPHNENICYLYYSYVKDVLTGLAW